jgi:hypothetical protein
VRRTESTMFSTFYSDQVMKFFPLHHFFPAHQKKKEKRKCIFLFFSNHIVIAMRFSDQHLPPTSVSRPSTESLERYRIYDWGYRHTQTGQPRYFLILVGGAST